jgi:YD repeat-containing protein
MTVIPSPTDANPSHELGATYDAWNRLVEVTDGDAPVAKFVYDGDGRRIEQLNVFVGGVSQNATHYYLNTGNQVLETREGSPNTAPESLNTKYQNVWSSRYVDAMVLRDVTWSNFKRIVQLGRSSNNRVTRFRGRLCR